MMEPVLQERVWLEAPAGEAASIPYLEQLRALRRIFDLAPDEGRQIIVSQIAQSNSRLTLATRQLLPDRSLPELNAKLVSRLEAGQFVDTLILRYATGDVVGRVEKAYLKRNQEQDRQNVRTAEVR